MSIRFDSAYNARIRKEVQNFNQKRKRMEQRGFKNLPNKVLVSDLKSRYKTRNELNRELNRLRNFKRSDINKRTLDSGAKIMEWQYDFLKANQASAIQYFEEEYQRINKKVGKFPGERTYLDTISAKLNILHKDINLMSEIDARSVLNSVNEFAMSPAQRKAQYRGFLREVDWVMEKLGYSDEARDNFFKKFHVLTPSQFLYAYDNNDLINKVYTLYHKDNNEEEPHLTDPKAGDFIEELIEQVDDIIKEAQTNMD